MAYARLPSDEETLDAPTSANIYAPNVASTLGDVDNLHGADFTGQVSNSQEADSSVPYQTIPSSSPAPPAPPRPSSPAYQAPGGFVFPWTPPPVQNPSTFGSALPPRVATLNYSQLRSASQQPYQPTIPLSQGHARSYYPPNASTGLANVPATGRFNSAPPRVYPQQPYSAQPQPSSYLHHAASDAVQQPPFPYPQQSYSAQPQPSGYLQHAASAPVPQPPLSYPQHEQLYPAQSSSYPQPPYAAPTPYAYAPSYVTPSYPQQYSSPQPDPYAWVSDGYMPPSQTPYPQPQPQPTALTRPHTTADAAEEPSSGIAQTASQSSSGAWASAASRVWVQDGSASTAFIDADALTKYLRLFPEADNDQGCRVFRYGPGCATALLMPLFESLDFSRFSQFPYGLSGHLPVTDQWGSGSCTCERCYGGQLCGHYVLSKNLRFYLPIESLRPVSPSPNVESNMGVMSISAGTRRFDFYRADWNMQLFRFRSRRSETTIFAYDALIYQDYELEVKVKGTPLDYIFSQLDNVISGWDAVLSASLQFLASFRVEVLEERLNTDRGVVRSLVAAAQHWEEFRQVLNAQLQRLEFLENVYSDPRWTEGRENHFETLSLASAYLQKLRAVDFRIQTELMQETDGLIQRVTNLISIDEGYRSRDQNESIRRLTWITFIFLPLLFTSALFSMQIDVFKDPSPWQYYIYASLVLMSLIFCAYAILRSRRRVIFFSRGLVTYPFRILHRLVISIFRKCTAEKPSEDKTDIERQGEHLASETATAMILKWAASSGNVDVLRNVLLADSSKGKSTNTGAAGEALIMAIQNGHVEAANLLIDMKESLLYEDSNGATPLHWAARGGQSSVCQALLQHGAKPNARNLSLETALDWAMDGGDERTINLLLKGDKKFTRLDSLNLQSLHFSARLGDLNTVKHLSKKGSSLEMRDDKGQTVLFHAVKGKQHAVVKWLLKDDRVNVQAVDKDGFTALHIAAQLFDDKIVSWLIKNGANVNALSNLHLAPLHMIADAAMTDTSGLLVLDILCENGANINAKSKDGSRITHQAASAGSMGTKLLEAAGSHGVDLNARDSVGNTPAHCAAAAGCQQSLEFLARESVDIIHCRNTAGYTPLMTAAQAGQTLVMKYLLELGASYSVADAGGRSLVELSIDWGNPAVIFILRKAGAKYDPITDEVHPVWKAVRDGQPGTVLEQLLAGGLSVEYSHNGVRLLQLALESCNTEAATILLERGAVVDAVDSYGWTALHSAAFGGDVPLLLLVLQRVSDRAAKDNQGWTPLNIAAFYDHHEVEMVLDPDGKMERFAPPNEVTFVSEDILTVFSGSGAAYPRSIEGLFEAPGD